jgi:hypothetical protein
VQGFAQALLAGPATRDRCRLYSFLIDDADPETTEPSTTSSARTSRATRTDDCTSVQGALYLGFGSEGGLEP